MLSFIKKTSLIVFLYSGMLFQSCQSPSGTEDPAPTNIDGLASATGQYFHVDSVRVSSTRADMYWRDYWDDGDTQVVKYGTDLTYSLGTLSMKPFVTETTTKTTLLSLTPNTHYYVKFCRFYRDAPPPTKQYGNVTFDFTTPAN